MQACGTRARGLEEAQSPGRGASKDPQRDQDEPDSSRPLLPGRDDDRSGRVEIQRHYASPQRWVWSGDAAGSWSSAQHLDRGDRYAARGQTETVQTGGWLVRRQGARPDRHTLLSDPAGEWSTLRRSGPSPALRALESGLRDQLFEQPPNRSLSAKKRQTRNERRAGGRFAGRDLSSKWVKWAVVTLAKQDEDARNDGKSGNSPKKTGKTA